MGQPHPELTGVSHGNHVEQNHENPGTSGGGSSWPGKKKMIRVVLSLGDTISLSGCATAPMDREQEKSRGSEPPDLE